MDLSNLFGRLLIIAVSLTCLYFIENFIKEKTQGSDSAKWRLRIGGIQYIFALASFIWLLKNPAICGKGLYIILILGTILLAVLGLGEILIGILNTVKSKKGKFKSKTGG